MTGAATLSGLARKAPPSALGREWFLCGLCSGGLSAGLCPETAQTGRSERRVVDLNVMKW